MNNKTMSIGFLSITALILFIAHFIPVQPAEAANFSIKDRSYSLVTARSAKGGDIVYVADNRTGQVAVFAWDAARRTLQPKGVGSLSDALKR
jgi:hypothetical protein